MLENNELSDELSVELSDENGPKLLWVPERPSASASKDDWVNYLVSLGASREYLLNTTHHFLSVLEDDEDDRTLGYQEDPPFTKDDLIALAERLGG